MELSGNGAGAAGIDTSVPNVVRIYDYILGGIRQFLEIVEPGVVWIGSWRPDPGIPPAGRRDSLYGGVGRKPAP